MKRQKVAIAVLVLAVTGMLCGFYNFLIAGLPPLAGQINVVNKTGFEISLFPLGTSRTGGGLDGVAVLRGPDDWFRGSYAGNRVKEGQIAAICYDDDAAEVSELFIISREGIFTWRIPEGNDATRAQTITRGDLTEPGKEAYDAAAMTDDYTRHRYFLFQFVLLLSINLIWPLMWVSGGIRRVHSPFPIDALPPPTLP